MEVTFEISTSGLVESQGFVFAKNGRFKEARRLKRPTGNQPPSMVMEEFSVEFIGFDLLSNEEYAKSVQMDRPTSAYLINRAQGNYSYIDPQGKEKHISTLAAIKERFSPTSSSSNWLWPVVALHALLFAAGAGWYLWHRRRVAVAG